MHVRKGENVVGVFYGHPGVFVSPSHRTIDIAHREGYTAKMLPGVSAEDCLFADLNIDPSVPGCMTYEATDLLIRKKPLNPASHLIIFQVGCVGITDFNFAGFKVRRGFYLIYRCLECGCTDCSIQNINFNFLLDYLELVYCPEHTVIHYIANILPFVEPTIDKYTIAELRDAETQKKITGISTFYLPPKSLLGTVEEMAAKLGLVSPGKEVKMPHYPAVRFMERHDSPADAGYEGLERSAIKEIETHLAPQGYKATCISPAMADLMTKLALDPKALAEYKQDPALYIEHTPGLTPLEMQAMKLGKQGTILRVMKGSSSFPHFHSRISKPRSQSNSDFVEGYDSISESENQDWSVQIDVVEIADVIEAIIIVGT